MFVPNFMTGVCGNSNNQNKAEQTVTSINSLGYFGWGLFCVAGELDLSMVEVESFSAFAIVNESEFAPK